MTPAAILKVFDVENPRPEQLAVAIYLSECSQVEMAVVEMNEREIDTVEKVVAYLDRARRHENP